MRRSPMRAAPRAPLIGHDEEALGPALRSREDSQHYRLWGVRELPRTAVTLGERAFVPPYAHARPRDLRRTSPQVIEAPGHVPD